MIGEDSPRITFNYSIYYSYPIIFFLDKHISYEEYLKK